MTLTLPSSQGEEKPNLSRYVLEEERNDGDSDLRDRLKLVVEGKHSSREKAEAVRLWMQDGAPLEKLEKLRIGAAEDRPKNAELLLKTREGACREFNIFSVTCMRALGIPARHGVASWWYSRPGRHFCSQYWDFEKKEWVIFGPPHLSVDGTRRDVLSGRWNTMACYALDSYPEEVDPYGRDDRSTCVNISRQYTKLYEMKANLRSSFKVTPKSPVMLSVWNSGSWRAVLAGKAAKGENSTVITFQVAKGVPLNRPILFSAVNEDGLRCAFAKPEEGEPDASLKELKEGEWIHWGVESKNSEK